MADETHTEEQLYHPQPGEAQLTVRAVITGCLLGAVVASMNIYFGLRTGWSIGGSLIAAILGFAVWTGIRSVLHCRPYTALETNITQTSGSAAGSMASAAGLLSSIPALGLLGVKLSYGELVMWAMAVGFLGVFFAVPLRNQMVVVEKLRFPTGTATAETIVSMFASGAQAIMQAKVLVWTGAAAGAFTLAMFFIPQIGHPPNDLLGIAALTAIGAWGFSILISPLMFGAGILIGPRVATSLLLGVIVGWAILGPMANDQGWVEGPIMSYQTGPRGWILWPGVAIMVGDAFANLALSWRIVLRTFRRPDGGELALEDGGMESADQRIPNSWWIIGLCCGTTLVTFVAWQVFDIPPWMTLIAVIMSAGLSMIAVRSTGETDINPTGGMGKVTQLVFGGVAPGQMTTNLMGAAITSAGASQAGDMMQDLKTGRLLGASPRRQIIAQCCGICAGIPVCTGIFKLFDAAYEIGSTDIPAPAAQSWRAMAEVLSKGFDELPMHAEKAIMIGLVLGAMIPILRKSIKPLAPYLPSGLAFGIAFIVPAYYGIAMFLGAMMLVAWKKLGPATAAIFAIPVASGLIAGEGLMGIVNAVLTLLGVQPLT